MAKTFEFSVSYETRGLVIHGTATVVGDYDGPSKPEAMVRAAMADETMLRLVLMTIMGEQPPE